MIVFIAFWENRYKRIMTLKKLNIIVSEESKKVYNHVLYYKLKTLKLIFQNMTLRSSSLTNINLNDTMEKVE